MKSNRFEYLQPGNFEWKIFKMGKKDEVKKSQLYGYDYDFSSEYVEEDQFECRVDSARTLFGLIAASFNKQSF